MQPSLCACSTNHSPLHRPPARHNPWDKHYTVCHAPLNTSSCPACTMCIDVSMSVRAMVPLSMPSSFHMNTPSDTPMPKMLFLRSAQRSARWGERSGLATYTAGLRWLRRQ